MPLGREVGLVPGHIVLDGTQLSLPESGTAVPPLFGPCLLWPNGLGSCGLTVQPTFEATFDKMTN